MVSFEQRIEEKSIQTLLFYPVSLFFFLKLLLAEANILYMLFAPDPVSECTINLHVKNILGDKIGGNSLTFLR